MESEYINLVSWDPLYCIKYVLKYETKEISGSFASHFISQNYDESEILPYLQTNKPAKFMGTAKGMRLLDQTES